MKRLPAIMPTSMLMIAIITTTGMGLAETDEWEYHRPVTLSPATPLGDFQVRIAFDVLSFDYSKARPDGADIRFYDLNDNKLSYWIENYDPTGTSAFWVKIPTTGTTTIRMHYGKPGANSESNGAATFDFFDDFEDGDYADKWLHTKLKDCGYGVDCTGYATWTEENGRLTPTDCCQTPVVYPNCKGPAVLISRGNITITGDGHVLDVVKSIATASAGYSQVTTMLVGTSMYDDPIASYDRRFGVVVNTFSTDTVYFPYPPDYNSLAHHWVIPMHSLFRYLVKYDGSSGWSVVVYDENGGMVHSADDVVSYGGAGTLKVMLRAHSPGSSWDEIKIRKYADTEPAAVIGDEVRNRMVAAVDIDPDTLNLNSRGRWITCYIALPEGHDVADIDIDTVELLYNDSSIPSERGAPQGGILMVKFDRQSLVGLLAPGDLTLVVRGELSDGHLFEGDDTIQVIEKGK
ncbi:MAG: DUF2341 domain-containing protein [bacterium]|nr:DUF2341 domain-containing protein [bacterium]